MILNKTLQVDIPIYFSNSREYLFEIRLEKLKPYPNQYQSRKKRLAQNSFLKNNVLRNFFLF